MAVTIAHGLSHTAAFCSLYVRCAGSNSRNALATAVLVNSGSRRHYVFSRASKNTDQVLSPRLRVSVPRCDLILPSVNETHTTPGRDGRTAVFLLSHNSLRSAFPGSCAAFPPFPSVSHSILRGAAVWSAGAVAADTPLGRTAGAAPVPLPVLRSIQKPDTAVACLPRQTGVSRTTAAAAARTVMTRLTYNGPRLPKVAVASAVPA